MNILYIGSHSILEYDEVRLLTDLGHDVFSIGSYTDPAHPTDDKRPAIDAPYHAELDAICRRVREDHAGENMSWLIDPAKAYLAPDIVEWADTIIFAAFPDAWLVPQWSKLRGKRVIWRTIGQSDPTIERYVAPLFPQGLEIVRYSPAERRAFESIGVFAGETAMIRFAKYPADWYGWTGTDPVIGNVTQDMAGRGEACGYSFWLRGTQGLAAKPAGPNSEALPGGIGALSYEDLRTYLRSIRAYLYTGTQPASYTLGLIEAMMTGVPIVTMGPENVGFPPLYEAHEITTTRYDAATANTATLPRLLAEPHAYWSGLMRQRALELFSADVVGPQWAALLGAKVAVAA